MPIQVVVAGAMIAGNALLVAQRARPPELAGLWELPGGKVATGETDVTVGARLGIDVTLNPTTALRAYLVTQTGGMLHPIDHRALKWITVDELDALDWVPADRTWLAEIKQALTT